MDKPELIHYCKQQGLVTGSAIEVTPLAGGVSSNIVLVEDGERRFVLKQSLAKLKVADAWYCDTDRNLSEYRAIQYAAQFSPQSIPQLLHVDAENKLFCMEYLGKGYVPWKQQLLEGQIDCEVAEKLANLLAILHESTWESVEVKQTFDTSVNFHALRIEPYLLTTGQRHSELKEIMDDEAQRLEKCRLALVHGDWSAKNVLVSAERLVVLDWEVVWFGDPAFDSAFLLNLLYLKSLYRRDQLAEYLELIETFRSVYRAKMSHYDEALEGRICRLTQMLMLGRIDGKSPAEYLTDQEDKNLVRQLISKTLLSQVDDFDTFNTLWRKAVAER